MHGKKMSPSNTAASCAAKPFDEERAVFARAAMGGLTQKGSGLSPGGPVQAAFDFPSFGRM